MEVTTLLLSQQTVRYCSEEVGDGCHPAAVLLIMESPPRREIGPQSHSVFITTRRQRPAIGRNCQPQHFHHTAFPQSRVQAYFGRWAAAIHGEHV